MGNNGADSPQSCVSLHSFVGYGAVPRSPWLADRDSPALPFYCPR